MCIPVAQTVAHEIVCIECNAVVWIKCINAIVHKYYKVIYNHGSCYTAFNLFWLKYKLF